VIYERTSGITAADRSKAASDAAACAKVGGVAGPVRGPLAAADGNALELTIPVAKGAGGWGRPAHARRPWVPTYVHQDPLGTTVLGRCPPPAKGTPTTTGLQNDHANAMTARHWGLAVGVRILFPARVDFEYEWAGRAPTRPSTNRRATSRPFSTWSSDPGTRTLG